MHCVSGHFACERQTAAHALRQMTATRMDMMMHNMEGMGWMMGLMGLVWVLVLVFLVLGIAAFVKYLRSGQ